MSGVTTLLVLCGMVCVFANNIFNYHAHVLLNGSIVHHAHPYNKTAEESNSAAKHSHKQNELLLINAINHFLYVKPPNVTIDANITIVEVAIDINHYHNIDSHYSLQSLRAPPIFII